MVPFGSSPADLQRLADDRGWRINEDNVRSWPVGSPTYMHDHRRDCRSGGGPVIPVIVASYRAPFETTVETLWLFDPQKRLQALCLRKTVNAL